MKVSIIGGGPGGLYFALLAKKAWPRWDITVYERNRPDDTFGFGVVFSDQTLDAFKAYDLATYERIRRRFAYWGDVDVVYKGKVMRSGGNGFCGCSRVALLNILQDRGRELGVQMRFQREVEGLEEFADSDLVVIADGLNSKIRSRYEDHFQPTVDLRPNKFTWLGSTKPLDAFKYFFRETPEGTIVAHCYQYEPDRSTWVIETDEQTWRNFNFDQLSETEMLPVIERVFAEELEGHALIANRSLWRNFPTITNKTWVKGNAVLVGDAKAMAHFSIGSGTKLAIASSIASLVPEPMEKCAVALASPTSTALPLTHVLLVMVGKLRQRERLAISLWPSSSSANTSSITGSMSVSESWSKLKFFQVCSSVSITQVERSGSYW